LKLCCDCYFTVGGFVPIKKYQENSLLEHIKQKSIIALQNHSKHMQPVQHVSQFKQI